MVKAVTVTFDPRALQVTRKVDILTPLGALYYNTGRYEEALQVYKEAAALQPDSTDIWLALVRGHARTHARTHSWDSLRTKRLLVYMILLQTCKALLHHHQHGRCSSSHVQSSNAFFEKYTNFFFSVAYKRQSLTAETMSFTPHNKASK